MESRNVFFAEGDRSRTFQNFCIWHSKLNLALSFMSKISVFALLLALNLNVSNFLQCMLKTMQANESTIWNAGKTTCQVNYISSSINAELVVCREDIRQEKVSHSQILIQSAPLLELRTGTEVAAFHFWLETCLKPRAALPVCKTKNQTVISAHVSPSVICKTVIPFRGKEETLLCADNPQSLFLIISGLPFSPSETLTIYQLLSS